MDRALLVFLIGASLVVLFQAIKGWRLGLVRQLVRLGAIVAAYAVGFFGGKPFAPLLRPLGYPDFVLQAIAGAGLGLATYLLIILIARILLKRTADQEFGITWFLFGVTGALVGVAFGLLLVWAATVGIRLAGSFIESPARKLGGRPSLHSGQHSTASPFVGGLTQLKQSLETGSPGDVFKRFDPVPKDFYEVSRKLGVLASEPDAIERLLAYPGAKQLSQQPEIAALRDDPEIGQALKNRDYLALMKNRHLVNVMNSPKLAEIFKKFEFVKALNYAVGKQ